MDSKWGIELVGQVLDGRYRIVSALERGEHGAFYLAEDQRVVGRQLMVQVPDPELAWATGFQERWATEIERISELDHPRVLKLLSGGAIGEVPCVLAEYLQGGNLQERLQGGLLAPQQVLGWLPEVAESLDFMHAEGIAHGDLKPSNIFFDALDHAYVADFGIAKAAGLISAEGGAEGDRRQLARVVFEVLFGQPPEEQSNLPAFLTRALPGFNSMAQALARALSGSRRDAYPTCKRFAEAVGSGLSPLPLPARPAPGADPVPSKDGPASRKRPAPRVPAAPLASVGDEAQEAAREDFQITAPAGGSRGRALILAIVLIAAGAGLAYQLGWVGKAPPGPPASPSPTPRPPLPALELKSDSLQLGGKASVELAWVAPGTYQMGCSEEDAECEVDEKPLHPVQLDGFWISKTEITQKQWQAVMKTNPSAVQGDDLPVTNVSWNDVQAFLKKAGQGMRLPSEAEWEAAARQGFYGPRHGELDKVAWYAGNSGGKVQGVGLKQASPLGLMDMLGNVREWCQDGYKLAAYKASGDAKNPVVEADPADPKRVIRGGAWDQEGRQARVSFRLGLSPQTMTGNLGFRVARSSP